MKQVCRALSQCLRPWGNGSVSKRSSSVNTPRSSQGPPVTGSPPKPPSVDEVSTDGVSIDFGDTGEGVAVTETRSLDTTKLSKKKLQSDYLNAHQLDSLNTLLQDIVAGASITVEPTYSIGATAPFGHVGLKLTCKNKAGCYQITLDWFAGEETESHKAGHLQFGKKTINQTPYADSNNTRGNQSTRDQAKTLLLTFLEHADQGYHLTSNNCSQIVTRALIKAGYIDRSFLESDAVKHYRGCLSLDTLILSSIIKYWGISSIAKVPNSEIDKLAFIPSSGLMPQFDDENALPELWRNLIMAGKAVLPTGLTWVDILDAGIAKKNNPELNTDQVLKELYDWRSKSYDGIRFQDIIDAKGFEQKDNILKQLDSYRDKENLTAITVSDIHDCLNNENEILQLIYRNERNLGRYQDIQPAAISKLIQSFKQRSGYRALKFTDWLDKTVYEKNLGMQNKRDVTAILDELDSLRVRGCSRLRVTDIVAAMEQNPENKETRYDNLIELHNHRVNGLLAITYDDSSACTYLGDTEKESVLSIANGWRSTGDTTNYPIDIKFILHFVRYKLGSTTDDSVKFYDDYLQFCKESRLDISSVDYAAYKYLEKQAVDDNPQKHEGYMNMFKYIRQTMKHITFWDTCHYIQLLDIVDKYPEPNKTSAKKTLENAFSDINKLREQGMHGVTLSDVCNLLNRYPMESDNQLRLERLSALNTLREEGLRELTFEDIVDCFVFSAQEPINLHIKIPGSLIRLNKLRNRKFIQVTYSELREYEKLYRELKSDTEKQVALNAKFRQFLNSKEDGVTLTSFCHYWLDSQDV